MLVAAMVEYFGGLREFVTACLLLVVQAEPGLIRVLDFF